MSKNVRMSRITPLKISAGEIRRDLEGATNPEAIVYLAAVRDLPDRMKVVIDQITYNRAKMKGAQDEDAKGLEEQGVGGQPEPGSGSED